MQIVKLGTTVVVLLNNGSYVKKEGVTDAEINLISNATEDEEVVRLLCPDYKEKVENKERVINIFEGAEGSDILTVRGECVYWDEVSGLSLPLELVSAILKAEEEGNELLLETYRNFWTLMSLNPDETCRKNLFWFLKKWGMVISHSGFFVAYRNVDHSDEDGVYTDNRTHKFRIKMGEIVSMPRKDCDSNHDVSCSSGLHLGGTRWLEMNYCGEVGIACLCNPADVVAVPHIDDYGKLRTCAYLPIAEVGFDDDGKVIPIDEKDGFDCSYVSKVIYEGLCGTEDNPYKIEIPSVPGLDKETISSKILDIAKECIMKRVMRNEDK